MGQNQSTAANWSVDNWASGIDPNPVSIEGVFQQTRQISTKYFGGEAVQNDASMHQMQRDLLSFDETFKNLFQKNKNQPTRNYIPTEDGYYYYDEQQQTIDSQQCENSASTVVPETNSWIDIPNDPNKLFWRCTNCAAENKKTEYACRRCGEAETQL